MSQNKKSLVRESPRGKYKFLVAVFMVILMISMVSAFGFDNVRSDINEYQEITITNAFGLGDDIAKVRWDTPIEGYKTGVGRNQTLAEFTIFQYYESTYEDALENMEFYFKANMRSKEKDFYYQYKTVREQTDETCFIVSNITLEEKCLTNTYNIIEWNDYVGKDMFYGEKNFRIIGDTYQGEYGELIPTFYGERMPEYSSWNSSLDTDNIAYYDVQNNTYTDRTGITGNGTGRGNPSFSAGLIGNAIDLDGSNDSFTINALDAVGTSWSISTWFKSVDGCVAAQWLMDMDNGNPATRTIIGCNSGNLEGWYATSAEQIAVWADVDDGVWHHVVMTADGTNAKLYLDGISVNNQSVTATILGGSNNAAVGSNRVLDSSEFIGSMDEIGFWNRTLSGDEVIQLFNGTPGSPPGAGIEYGSPPVDSPPAVTLISPANASQIVVSDVNFLCNVTDDINLSNASFILDGIINETNITAVNGTYNFSKTFIDGQYNWTCGGIDNASQATNASARTFQIHTVPSTVIISNPTGALDFITIGDNLTINWSVTEAGQNLTAHITNCTLGYNGVLYQFNNSECINGTNSSTNITYVLGANTLNFTSVDQFNFSTTNTTSWNYQIIKESETFAASITEGGTSTFTTNVITNGTAITLGSLNYNGSLEVGSVSAVGNNYTVSRTRVAPIVVSDTNVTFFWNLTTSIGFNKQFDAQNQTVISMGVGSNCTAFTETLYNFTQVDEETQVVLASNTAKINLQILNPARTNEIISFASNFSTNPFAICLNNNLTSGEEYVIDVQMEYSSAGYAIEFYHIQNESLTNADFPTNITLYSINATDSTPFRLLVRDSLFLPLGDALVFVDRRYVEEGEYKTVEIPKTNDGGTTIANLVVNDVIYRFRIIRFGESIKTVTDVRVNCLSTLNECEIDFDAFESNVEAPEFSSNEDFNFTLGYNETSRVISSIFVIPSNDPAAITLNVTKQDALGSQVCTDVLTSTSGTLSCIVPTSFGNETITATLLRGGVFQAYGQIKLDQNPNDLYGNVVVFFGLFMMLSLIGLGMSDNPVITAFLLLVGVILLFGLNIVANNGFVGATASVLYLFIAILILLIKGVKRS